MLPLVLTLMGLSVTENPELSENCKDIVESELGSTPLVLIVMGVSGRGEVVEREVIATAELDTVIVNFAEPNFVVSSVLVAVTVTGLVLGRALGAV